MQCKDTKWLPKQYNHLRRLLCLDFLTILDASCFKISPFWINWELQSQANLQNIDNCFKGKNPTQQKMDKEDLNNTPFSKNLALI